MWELPSITALTLLIFGLVRVVVVESFGPTASTPISRKATRAALASAIVFCPRRAHSYRPHSPSASRRAASLSGFFILSQYGDRPET